MIRIVDHLGSDGRVDPEISLRSIVTSTNSRSGRMTLYGTCSTSLVVPD